MPLMDWKSPTDRWIEHTKENQRKRAKIKRQQDLERAADQLLGPDYVLNDDNRFEEPK